MIIPIHKIQRAISNVTIPSKMHLAIRLKKSNKRWGLTSIQHKENQKKFKDLFLKKKKENVTQEKEIEEIHV